MSFQKISGTALGLVVLAALAIHQGRHERPDGIDPSAVAGTAVTVPRQEEADQEPRRDKELTSQSVCDGGSLDENASGIDREKCAAQVEGRDS